MVNKYDQDEKIGKFKWSVISRTFKYLKSDSKALFLVFIVLAISTISALFYPKVFQYVLDVVVPNSDYGKLYGCAIFTLSIAVIGYICYVVQGKLFSKIQQGIIYNLKNDVFNHLQHLPAGYFDTRSHGKILIRVTNYPENIASVCTHVLRTISEFVSLIIVVVFMFMTNVPITILVLLIALLFACFFVIITPIRRRKMLICQNKSSNSNAFLSESLNGLFVTEAFNREKKNTDIYMGLEQARINSFVGTLKYSGLTWSLSGVVSYIALIIIYIIGFYFFYPAVSIGIIAAMGSYSSWFWRPISNLTFMYNDFMDSISYLERIFEVLDEPIVIENNKKNEKLSIYGEISFKNVSFGYDKKLNVLENINLEIPKNNMVALVGETGSGKSTIANLICRNYDVTGGTIFIDGVPIQDINLETLRSQVCMMLQDNYVFERSVLDNLKYGNPEATEKEIIEVCKQMNIDSWIKELSDGYHTILYNNASQLSTGQRQLLCLARTLIAGPKILILDEATSNIDVKTEQDIQRAIKFLSGSCTCVIIAHRLSTITSCDNIFVVKNKKIAEEGTHEELLKLNGEYYKLYSQMTDKKSANV